MDAELGRYVERASDPRLIGGIYNYCNRRCERCPFTDRCLTFHDMRDDAVRETEPDLCASLEKDFSRTVDLLKAWCEREGVDFDKLQVEANSEAMEAESARLDDDVRGDPLFELALDYTTAACAVVSGLERLAPFHEWPPVVREALETIGWHASLVSMKVGRALFGFAGREASGGDEDPIQNDWNGSAKVARLAIAESQRAWDTLLLVGQAPPDAPLRQTRERLDRIDAELASRFPQSMAFIRPGFDEPEVAAGALSTLAAFEPRTRQRPQRGVVAWLHRIASAWPRRS